MWARIENGIVMEVVAYDPQEFHPIGEWVECGNDVSDNWLYSNGVFSEKPVEVVGAEPALPEEFRGLNLSLEAIAAVQAGTKTLEVAIQERGPLPPAPEPVDI